MKYAVGVVLFVGAMFWVGAEYTWVGSKGTGLEAQSSPCMIKSDPGQTACSTVATADLSSLNDGNQNDLQRTDYGGAVATTQAATGGEVEADGRLSGDLQSDIEFTNVLPAGGFSEVDDGVTFSSEEPQYIGEFFDPDDASISSLASDGIPVSIGDFIDPDSDMSYLADDAEQIIGLFVDPDADLAIGNRENQ